MFVIKTLILVVAIRLIWNVTLRYPKSSEHLTLKKECEELGSDWAEIYYHMTGGN